MPTPGYPPLTLAQVENLMVQMGFSQAQIAAFAAWYAAAVRQDPALTPEQGYTVWALGTGISGNIGTAGQALGQIPGAAAAGAEKAVKTLSPVTNPLDFLRNIAGFFDRLTEASTWLRIAEFVLGAGLILVGLAKLASGTAAGQAARKIATKAAIL